MLFEQLPTAALVALLAVSCAVKYAAVRRLIYTRWYRLSMQGRRWYLALTMMCTVSGTLSWCIFDRFVSWPVSLYIGAMDALLHVLSGLYVKYSDFLEKESSQTQPVVTSLRLIHACVYASFIWLSFRYG